jgi:hypothetical protein
MRTEMKVVWVSTWNNICGIADYSRELWPAIEKSLVERGDMGSLVSIDQYSKILLFTLSHHSSVSLNQLSPIRNLSLLPTLLFLNDTIFQ